MEVQLPRRRASFLTTAPFFAATLKDDNANRPREGDAVGLSDLLSQLKGIIDNAILNTGLYQNWRVPPSVAI